MPETALSKRPVNIYQTTTYKHTFSALTEAASGIDSVRARLPFRARLPLTSTFLPLLVHLSSKAYLTFLVYPL